MVCLSACAHVLMYGYTDDVWMYGCMDVCMDGRMDVWMYECTDVCSSRAFLMSGFTITSNTMFQKFTRNNDFSAAWFAFHLKHVVIVVVSSELLDVGC